MTRHRKKSTVYLDPADLRRLRELKERTRVPTAIRIRDALRRYLDALCEHGRMPEDCYVCAERKVRAHPESKRWNSGNLSKAHRDYVHGLREAGGDE